MPSTKRQELAGECGLACAILELAVKDARRGNGHALGARAFLCSTWAAELLAGVCDVLALDYDGDDLRAIAGEVDGEGAL